MRKVNLLIVSIVALALFSYTSDASIQKKQYQSVNLDCESGAVNTIYRKGNGSLWIGSKTIVGKLTDSGFKTYSVGAGAIHQIVQDSQDNLWVLADSALCRFSGLSGTFEKLDIVPTAALPLEKACLFAAGGTMYSYSDSKMSELGSFSSLGKFDVSDIFKLSGSSVLLVDRENGAAEYDVDSGKVSKCTFIPAGLSSIFVDSRQRIWIGRPGEGLTCIDASGRKLASYTTSSSNIPGNTVRFIGESGGKIVVLTDAGLCRVQPDQGGEIVVEKQETGDPSALPTTDISSMFCASDGSVWFGRRSGGVFVDRMVQIDMYDMKAWNIESISCIYSPAAQRKVWLGTSGAGVMVYDPSVASKPLSVSFLPHTAGMTVGSMANYSDSEILMACPGRGLMLLDKHSGSVRHLETGNLILDSFGSEGSSDIYEVCDGPQGSVILMSGSDMYRYNPSNRTVTEIHLPESVSGKTRLFASFPGETGLYYWNPSSLYEYDVMSNSLVEVIRFSDFSIKSASAAPDGNLWLGTDKGLVSMNRSTKKYEIFPLPCGCAPESVLCAPNGRVWVGTSKDLCFFDIASRRFVRIDSSDGIARNCYTDKAKYFSASDGELIMGGLNGFARVDAGITFLASSAPEIVLEGIYSADGKAHKAFGCKLSGDYPVTIEVSANEENILRDRMYKFIVDGPGKYREETVTELPTLTLSNLPQGSFSVSVSCSLKTGEWTEKTDVASFKIGHPWYMSHILYFLVFFALAGIAAYFFITRNKTRNQGAKQTLQSRSTEERLNFLVNISHELRTPLTLIMGPLEKAVANMTPSDPNFKRLKGAFKQTKKMKTLLDTVLTAAKVEADGTGGSLNLTYQSFNNWVKHVVSDFKEEADARNINLNVEYGSKIGMLDFDEEKCQVVLSNILMNAFAHNPDDSEIQVWTETHPERAAVRVSVSDRGAGIKDEDMAEIFNRYYQSTEENHGYGIGLAYSKQIMDNMHGVIGAYNNSHGGATFYFELPTTLAEHLENTASEQPSAPAEPVREIISAKPSVPSSVLTESVMPRTIVDPNALPFEEPRNIPDPVIDLKNANLLIVEDDVALRNYLKDELSESLANVFVAGNGVEAVKVLNAENVNVVVSDVMMPEMDGFTLCRYIKTTVSISHIPVILLTARSDENSRLLGYKNGADDYITKPFDLDVLKDSIQRLFFSRESMRQRFSSPLAPMPSAEETTFSSADENFLQKFNKLVQDNISDPDLDSKFLVDNMGMSRTVLFNKVKQLTGLNLQNYVNKTRMEYVIKLMSTTNLSLGEIAEKSGFSSPRYFSTSFKNYTGVTPTQYKRDHR